MKDIIRYAYYVTSANFYGINDSSNLALRYCIFNELPKFLFKENIFLAELNIFDHLKNSLKKSKIKSNTIDWVLVSLDNFLKIFGHQIM